MAIKNSTEPTCGPQIEEDPFHLGHEKLQALCDRAFAVGCVSWSTIGPKERADFIAISRAVRALLRHHELVTGRRLENVFLGGRV